MYHCVFLQLQFHNYVTFYSLIDKKGKGFLFQ